MTREKAIEAAAERQARIKSRPILHFDKGMTGYRNVPGRGCYRFWTPFIVVGWTFRWTRIIHLGEWKRRLPRDPS